MPDRSIGETTVNENAESCIGAMTVNEKFGIRNAHQELGRKFQKSATTSELLDFGATPTKSIPTIASSTVSSSTYSTSASSAAWSEISIPI